jgi:hypothetical protein
MNEHPNETQALTIAEELPLARQSEPTPGHITPAQAKVDAIASLTMKAYDRASMLQITQEETAALCEDFPDEAFQPGAAGKEHLLYLQHSWLRERFSKVFGMGQWAIVPRKRWEEPFKTNNGKDASRVYVEAMLLVRGCFVGEAVGEMEYFPHNASQNYGDAVEGAKTAAFRRCAKEFGVGLQAWKKEWCEGWWQRRRSYSETSAQNTRHSAPASPPATNRGSNSRSTPSAQNASQSNLGGRGTAPNVPPATVTDDKNLFINQLRGKLGTLEMENLFLAFLSVTKNAKGEYFISDEGTLHNLELADLNSLVNHWDKTVNPKFIEWQLATRPERKPPTVLPSEKTPPAAEQPQPRPASLDSAMQKDPEFFWDVIVPIPRKGDKRVEYMKHPDTIGSLWRARHNDHESMKRLMGFASHFEPKGWTKANGQQMPASEADKAFRVALDAFLDWHAKHGEDTPPPQDELPMGSPDLNTPDYDVPVSDNLDVPF